MKTSYWFIVIIGILMWNGLMIKRDQELFKAYDACARYTHHPDCPQNKK